jgi:hypothetical protein
MMGFSLRFQAGKSSPPLSCCHPLNEELDQEQIVQIRTADPQVFKVFKAHFSFLMRMK